MRRSVAGAAVIAATAGFVMVAGANVAAAEEWSRSPYYVTEASCDNANRAYQVFYRTTSCRNQDLDDATGYWYFRYTLTSVFEIVRRAYVTTPAD